LPVDEQPENDDHKKCEELDPGQQDKTVDELAGGAVPDL
jgi:hypothetical protein